MTLGKSGEDTACEYLTGRGWKVVDRNWRFSGGGLRGELDVVALAVDGTLAVVEVKTRSGSGYGSGFDAVTPRKVAQLRALTAQWLLAHSQRFARVRIDVIEVFAPPGGPITLEHREAVA
ncbi:YraN family protein [Tsukamurella sp. 8F]|uniref:YraN family protein n=1 Tax=unclassified Tsukamurella TaxID=2633480 RepID=UPI0023B8D872|nr:MULTISPECIES: YraN family protein [unclassified Tsukamurella]MDF0528935.1 YraN family protein [Tsukamurella sp. 8J]MDF0589474.1 YraN family protein [Tsukamurella sp. 8F]